VLPSNFGFRTSFGLRGFGLRNLLTWTF
jgi:hypothetical protein